MGEHTVASRSRCLLLWLLVGVALWSETSCAKRQASTAPVPPEVQASAARNTVIVPTELLAGTIAPFQNVAIQTSLTEPTTAVNVNEGDIVHRGEVLALLDTRDLRADYQSFIQTARSNEAKLAQDTFQAPLTLTQGSSGVQSAQAMLAQAEKTLATDQVNLTRDQMLTTNGYIAQQIVDQQIALVANDQQSVRNLQASLTTAQALLTANGTINRGLPASIIQQGKADIATSLAQAAQIADRRRGCQP
jgi:multidrug efflux pump subunit AcrA (membrane-fusion protein)